MHKYDLFLSLVMTGAAKAEMPDTIASSAWAADPVEYGLTKTTFLQADSRAIFADLIGRSTSADSFPAKNRACV